MAQDQQIEDFKNLARNWINQMLQSLEETDFNIHLAALAQSRQAKTILDRTFQGLNNERQQAIETYFTRIFEHESIWPIFLENLEMFNNLEEDPYSRLFDGNFMAELTEKFREMLRKFLEVETNLTDQEAR